eukprot:TRINITY_DN1151_c0_g2_i2.p1 TRINITY_DN1151_c0_g2~~TRINITY_DN1151_c0_g2_i2.p1  ORF type:complete len:121 (-),score=24.61 TRINITY_DN1151_c0_g2_i2:215-556(-)
MSKQILDSRAETVAYEKKSKHLEEQLQQEQKEILTLQQSLVTSRFDYNDQMIPPNEIMQSINKPALPEDISAVDIEYLSALGENDLNQNIALLRQHKSVDTVAEILINSRAQK